MSNPRVIAATASAALIAGVGAGAAVYAVDIATTNDVGQSSTQADQAPTLKSPKDDKTTVYRSEGSDDSASSGQQFQPAPPSTTWNNNGGKTKSNTSKSS